MLENPNYLAHYYAAAFQELGVAAAYHHRGTYPRATFLREARHVLLSAPRIRFAEKGIRRVRMSMSRSGRRSVAAT